MGVTRVSTALSVQELAQRAHQLIPAGCHTYSKADDLWVENVCAENTFEYYNNRDTPLPVGEKPDF